MYNHKNYYNGPVSTFHLWIFRLLVPKKLRLFTDANRTALNACAINNLLIDSLKVLLCLLVFGAVCYSVGISLGWCLILTFLGLVVTFVEIKYAHAKRLLYPYAFGEKFEAEVTAVFHYTNAMGKSKIDCRIVGENEVISIGPIFKKAWGAEPFPEVGQTLKVWVFEKHGMPENFMMQSLYRLVN